MDKHVMDKDRVLLGIYLNDHLMGATAGVELFRRASGSAPTAVKGELDRLAAAVTQDRESLLSLMRRLGVPVRRYKVIGGWAAEKVGRVKLNGSLLGRSPLSDLVELEGLVLGVQGKAAGFRALRSLAEHDGRLDAAELDRLIARAEEQGEALERLRLRAVDKAFGAANHAGGTTAH